MSEDEKKELNNTDNKGKKGTAKRSVFGKSVKFIEKIYKCLVEVEESIEKPVYKRGRIINEKVPTGRMIEVEKFRPDFIKENVNKEIALCRFRAAKYFDISIDHLKEAYDLLNGKKLDGFYITDLIDRFGFSKGEAQKLNRQKFAEKFGRDSGSHVDVAQEKLKQILKESNIKKSYTDYIKDFKEEFSKEIRDKVTYGE